MSTPKFFLCTFRQRSITNHPILGVQVNSYNTTFVCDMFSEGDVALLYKRLIKIVCEDVVLKSNTPKLVTTYNRLVTSLKEFVVDSLDVDQSIKVKLIPRLSPDHYEKLRLSSKSKLPSEINLVLYFNSSKEFNKQYSSMIMEKFESWQRMLESDYKTAMYSIKSNSFQSYKLLVVDEGADKPQPMTLVWTINSTTYPHFSHLDRRIDNYESRRIHFEDYQGIPIDDVDKLFVNNLKDSQDGQDSIINESDNTCSLSDLYESVIENQECSPDRSMVRELHDSALTYNPQEWGVNVAIANPYNRRCKYMSTDSYYKRVAEYLRDQYLRSLEDVDQMHQVKKWKYVNYRTLNSESLPGHVVLEVVFAR